jgi:hypothetical protein
LDKFKKSLEKNDNHTGQYTWIDMKTIILLILFVTFAPAQYITTQYSPAWSFGVHPSRYQRTDFVMWCNGSGGISTPPYWSFYAGSPDSMECATSQQHLGSGWYAVQDSLMAWAVKNNVKLVLSVLIGTGAPFWTNVMDTTMNGKADQMMLAATRFCLRNGYAGIDIDGEYPPNSDATRTCLTRWFRRVKEIMNTWSPKGVLFVTVPQWALWGGNASTPIYGKETWQYIDYVQIMAYNANSSTVVSHNQPVYSYPSMPSGGATYWDDRGWREYVQAGCPMTKIIFLASGEVKSYIGTNLKIGSAGTLSKNAYGEFRSVSEYPVSYFQSPQWDDAAKCTYFNNGTTFLSYESYRSMQEKANYVKAQIYSGQHLAGMGVYDPSYRLYDSRQAVPDSAMRGFVASFSAPTVIVPPVIVNPCDSAYQRGLKDGRASVLCPTPIDTAGSGLKNYKAGWNDCLSQIADSVSFVASGKVPTNKPSKK